MSDCVGYMGSFLHNMKKNGFWNNKRGENILDGGAPYYRTYKVYYNYKINQYFCLSARMGNILLLDALKVNSTEDFYKDWRLKI